MKFFKEELNNVRAFVFDVDGVLATSIVVLHPTGDMMRTMNTKDGYAMQYAVKHGFPIAIITGAKSESLKKRFQGLGITDIYLDSMDKYDDYQDFLYKYSIKTENVLFMGDDLPDTLLMKAAGVATCPSDACPEIKEYADYISAIKGGEGCVRDVIEQVLRVQNKWGITDQNYKQ